MPPVLSSPPHATLDVPLTPEFIWYQSDNAVSYRLKVSTSVNFANGTFVIDTTIADTVFKVVTPLLPGKAYFWRVYASNTYGSSSWSTQFGFKATTASGIEAEGLPKVYSLAQNYPNPFNPVTEIKFAIAKSGQVSLKVYDILGRETAVLVNENKRAGNYRIQFDASKFASGVYIYRLTAGGVVMVKKMVVLK